jgi:hypothetical protein
MCSGYADYPILLGGETLRLPGEMPGEINDGIIIQAVVSDYLLQYEGTYNPGKPEERLVNRTDILEPLNFIQSADTCQPGEFWQEELFSCASCPSQTSLTFLSSKLEFGNILSDQSIRLVNAELVSI